MSRPLTDMSAICKCKQQWMFRRFISDTHRSFNCHKWCSADRNIQRFKRYDIFIHVGFALMRINAVSSALVIFQVRPM